MEDLPEETGGEEMVEAVKSYAMLVLSQMCLEHSLHGSPRDYERIENIGGAAETCLVPSLKRAVMDAAIDARQELAGPPRRLKGKTLESAVLERVASLATTEASDMGDSLEVAVAREIRKEASMFQVDPKAEAAVKQSLVDSIFADVVADTAKSMASWSGV